MYRDSTRPCSGNTLASCTRFFQGGPYGFCKSAGGRMLLCAASTSAHFFTTEFPMFLCFAAQADHQDIIDIRSQAPPAAPVPAPAPILAPAHTCQGCGAVQQAVVSLQKQLHHRDLASAKGSTKANSAASTQDHSGDTLDDRCLSTKHVLLMTCVLQCTSCVLPQCSACLFPSASVACAA